MFHFPADAVKKKRIGSEIWTETISDGKYEVMYFIICFKNPE